MPPVRKPVWFCAALMGLSLATVAPTVHAWEHLRSQVPGHEGLWYYWSVRYLDYYVQDTGGSPLNVGPGAGLTPADIQAAAGRGFDEWQRQPCTDIQFTY